jgi:hypothetical protein
LALLGAALIGCLKENYEQGLDFALHLSCLFGLGEFGLFHSNTCEWLVHSSLNTCVIAASVLIALS